MLIRDLRVKYRGRFKILLSLVLAPPPRGENTRPVFQVFIVTRILLYQHVYLFFSYLSRQERVFVDFSGMLSRMLQVFLLLLLLQELLCVDEGRLVSNLGGYSLLLDLVVFSDLKVYKQFFISMKGRKVTIGVVGVALLF